MLSHVSSLRLSSGHSGLVLTLSNAARAFLFSPRLLVADASIWATSLLGVVVRHIICGFYLFIFLPVILPSEIPKLPTYPLVRVFLGVWKLLLFHNSLPRTDLCSLPLLSLFLSFIFCPTSFRRQWAAFLGGWCPPPAFRSCFVELAQHTNDLLMNLWGRKWSRCPIPLPS